jgi:coenzyme F420-reducing hydrogenase gamma subunit
MAKPSVSIYGLTGCAGDQLVILNCEDELLDILGAVDIHSFEMAQSRNVEDKVDIALVEGTVVDSHDEERLFKIRENSNLLVAMGTCAVWGGIVACKNDASRRSLVDIVYGRNNKSVKFQTPLPLSHFVKVDFAIPGCPIEKSEIIRALASLVHGDLPLLPTYPVCFECKMKENRCLLIEEGAFCQGPLSRAGCGALCPSMGQACIGCRGPVDEANISSEIDILREKGYSDLDILYRLRTFAYPAKAMDEKAKVQQ